MGHLPSGLTLISSASPPSMLGSCAPEQSAEPREAYLPLSFIPEPLGPQEDYRGEMTSVLNHRSSVELLTCVDTGSPAASPQNLQGCGRATGTGTKEGLSWGFPGV